MAPKPKEYDNKNDQHDSNQGTGKIQQKNDNSSSSSTTTLVSSKWNYLDPSGIERVL
jgi:hypothetical protein